MKFIQWCGDDNPEDIPGDMWEKQQCLHERYKHKEDITLTVTDLESKLTDSVLPSMTLFKEIGSKSPTFQLWMMFLDIVQILIWNIRTERESNWDMHIATQDAMLPLMFSANRTNYSRYTPPYLLDMLPLPEEVKKAFCDGQFTYREKPGCFNGLWSDMRVEKTVQGFEE